MKKVTPDEAGSVSWGTMVSRDLIERFTDFLEAHGYPGNKVTKWRMVLKSQDEEKLSTVLNEEIWDAMDELAPDGYSFGAHPGDGSDYGYWQDEFRDEEAAGYVE